MKWQRHKRGETVNKFLQAIRLALEGVLSNKMRSLLTMLGVIIGVAAVITLVSLGRGATANVSKQIEGMGSNLIVVTLKGRGSGTTMSLSECENLVNKPGIGAVAPSLTGSVTTKYNTTKYDTSLEGITADYSQVRNYSVSSGRFITALDVDYSQPVVLLGTTVSQQLFGYRNPVGATIKINGYEFQVVGLLASKSSSTSSASTAGSQDDEVMIPITTAEKILGTKTIRTVYIEAKDSSSVNLAVTVLNSYLLSMFKDTNAYSVFNQQDALSTLNTVTQTLTLFLSAIAGISLLVGGIGIMNIMLVSVTERTREIGIRKAIGAKRKDILMQFLIEAMALSGSGGIVGILFGVLVTSIIGKVIKISAVISPDVVLASFLFSLGVGVLFGIYPANKASKLNPIEALRFE